MSADRTDLPGNAHLLDPTSVSEARAWNGRSCPYFARYHSLVGHDPEATCNVGCYDEPACVTGEPAGGWPPESDDRCRYCGGPLGGPRTDDPRSEECSACLAEAHDGPENPAWLS